MWYSSSRPSKRCQNGRAGLGIIQAPRIGKYLGDDGLVEILPDFRPPPLPISMVYANRRHLPLRVKAFIEWMKQTMDAAGAAA